MLRKLLITLGLLFVSNTLLFAQQAALKGVVTDAKTGAPIEFATVRVEQDGQFKNGEETDDKGNYTIRGLTVGKYDIIVQAAGYRKQEMKGVQVSATGLTIQDISLSPALTDKEAKELDAIEVISYKEKLIDIGGRPGDVITKDQLDRMPTSTIEGATSILGGIGYSDGGTSTARGESGMITYQGQIKKLGGTSVPTYAVAEIRVILGGTPAQFGEAIGGVQQITLSPPANNFTGTVRYETTEFLDNRGYHRLDLYFTGPIWKEINESNVEMTKLGYRFITYGTYYREGLYRPDDRALYLLKEDVRKDIEQAPLRMNPINPFQVDYKANYLTSNDFEQVSHKGNVWSLGAYMNGGLDYRFSENAVLAVDAEYQFTRAMGSSLSNVVMNNANNSVTQNQSFQISADFTHRFPTKKAIDGNKEEKRSSLNIRELMYNLSGSYQYIYGTTKSADFGDDVFSYGYVGKYTIEREPQYTFERYSINGAPETWVYKQNGVPKDVNVIFDAANTKNPLLANYTSQLYNNVALRPYLINYTNIQSFGGLLNGGNPPSVYGLFYAPGTQIADYAKSQREQFYFQGRASAVIGPQDAEHSVEFGLQYEQIINRSYSLGARGLWGRMRNMANFHISQLDLENPIVDYSGTYPVVSFDQLYNAGDQFYFDKAFREKFGYDVSGTDWINTDAMNPNDYSLDMFSAKDLVDAGEGAYVSYTGYDHTGKIVRGKKSLDQYFNSDTRTLGAWMPTYMAGYIQDQFYFKNMIFNIGVRVDRYDGNQMVLKDPYLLHESYTVKELSQYTHPANAQGDWVVYVDELNVSEDKIKIKGYRSGATWYDDKGVEIADPNTIAGKTTRPTPYRKNTQGDSTNANPEPSVGAFKEYDPQYVVMPRIAFSFPVSEKSQFKASYDIIARRPDAGVWQANYYSYLNWYKTPNAIFTNPNLKPEKITNYEIGFEQVLNDVSVISMAAFYKETRDLIQLVQYAGADPQTVYSYDNLDFKTTKGLTIQYDLRRIKNARLTANYTLQYAEGSSLPQATMTSLIKAGYPNIKMLNPIWDDRRHEIKVNLDYRYESGVRYNGPRTTYMVKENGTEKAKEIRWFENAGINIVAVAQSGRPYTRAFSNMQNTIVGGYNSARLPWQFYVDMKIDKVWIVKVGKRATMIQAYAQVKNIFNIRNIMNVYPVTGDPDDNGYLTDPETQSIINSYASPLSYREMYSLNLLNTSYNNYSIPRQLVLGVSYRF